MKHISKWLGAFFICFRTLATIACIGSFSSIAVAQGYQIATGDDYGAVIDDTGNLFLWGAAQSNPGGLTQVLPAGVWQSVAVSRTSAAEAHYIAIQTDGTLWAWGRNDRGQLGTGDQVDLSDPVQISSATTWVEVAAGGKHSLARNSLGFVFAWGDNTFGQLNKTPIFNDPALDIQLNVPSVPIDFNAYISIAAGNAHNHAVRDDGTLWTWGSGGSVTNGGPELGILVDWDNDGHVDDYPIGPVGLTQVGDHVGWTTLFGGFDVTYALRDTLTETGQLWAWGAGGFVGDGDLSAILDVPTRIGTDADWVYISRASSLSDNNPHALALKSDGTLWGWGSNYPDGQLGLPIYDGFGNPLTLAEVQANSKRLSPVQLEAPDTFLAVGAGDGFSAVVRSDGFLLTAGRNDQGQLANGSIDATPATGQDFFDNSQLGVADLVAISVTVNELPENVGAGEIVSVSFEVQNAGTGAITDDFEIEAWLNTAPTVGGLALDFDIGAGVSTSLLVTDDFIAGQSRSLQFDVELPTNIPQGTYYVVVDADTGPVQPVGAIPENEDEINNSAATEVTFAFLPDLIVPTLPNGLTIINPPGDGTYDPGTSDTIDIELLIENIGEGTLPAGSTFDIRLFLSPDRSTDNSAIVDLNIEEPVVLAADLESGATLATALSFSYPVPRMPAGFFFVGVELDINNAITEQPEILDDNNIVVQADGEANNSAFSDSLIEISGITIIEAIDQDGSPLVFTTDGDGNWFGQSFIFNVDGDSVQSPSLVPGESASFSTSFNDYFGPTPTPVAISFDWSSETSSADNRLFFRVINGTTGGNNNEISGNTNGWIEDVTRVIPVNGLAEWVYEQGVEGVGDAVYVDDLQVTEIDQPDLVIDDIYLPPDATGSYVLQRDRLDLTVNSRNQGTDTSVAEDYVISIYLSTDSIFDRPDSDPLTPDDILIRQELVTEQIFSGDPAVNGFSINLDTDIEPGTYYVIGYIDDYTDANGDPLPGATQPSAVPVEGEFVGFVDEFTDPVGTAGLFPGEDNNLFVTGSAIVEVVALPDLQTSALTAVPNYYLINDPATDYAEPNSLPLNFTLTNQGLGKVTIPIQVAALFSTDEDFVPGSDYTLLDFNYTGSFGKVTEAPANTRFVNPDAVDFRANLVSEGFIGERLFLGVFVDSTDLVLEFDDTNNSFYLFSNDFILSELELGDGLDLDPALWDVPSPELNFENDELAPYDSDNVPWVGQTTETFDGVDAVTNTRIGDNETSKFSIDLNPVTGVRVSFWWKVSSQNELNAGVTQRDVLRFQVDGAVAVPDIFGTEDENWQRVEVVLDPGPHTLTWSYIKDNQGFGGEDRGWVDRLTITELPNLVATGISVDGTPTFQAGDTIDTWSFEIENRGDDIEAGTAFDVEVRLLANDQWAEADSVVLLSITDSTGIAAGETRTYDNNTDGVLTLPSVTYDQEFYYFGAYVDWSVADPDNGQISESSETDNSALTDEAVIQLGLPDLTGDAASISGLAAGYTFGDDVDIDLVFTNSGDGTLPTGASFDYRVYIAQTNDDQLIGSASVVELGSATVSVASDVASGADLASENFVAALPYGLAPGTYFIGVELDIGNTVEEQGLRPDGSGVDGETNNLFFSNLPVLQVNGITLQVALDDGNSPIALGTFEDEPGSAAFWFGRDDAGDSIPEDNQTFEEAEGAQTPVINAGDYAAFTLDVATSSVVRFKWGILSGSDQNVLTVSVNGVVVDSISGDVSLDEIDPGILVPDNGTVEWRYTKGAATQGDFAVVDDVRVELNNQPDLVLSAINYTPGEYILDVAGIGGAPNQLLGTEYLDISVEATNQGEDVIATQFTSADLEVRLSTDRVYGNADDILLGTVSQVEGDLLSGSLIRFIGPIQLGDSIPENSYYLIAKVDSNDEVAEFSEENNIFITENRDVEIKRLPALRIYNPNPLALSESIDGINNYLDPRDAGVVEVAFDIDDELNYYAEGPMRLRFSVQNIGLDRIEASETWTVQFRLRGARRDDLSDAVDIQGIIDAFDPDIELGDFTVTEQMDGRSEAQPTGDILDFDVELALPSGARLNDIIDEELSISDYLWIVVVELDSTDAIEESEIIRESPTLVAPSGRPWWIISLSEALLANHSATNGDPGDGMFGISGQPFLIDGGDWELIYFGNPTITEEGFLAYAFNRNPADSDTAGGQFPGTYGVTTFEGDDVFSITFDALTRATDISYVVEAADTLPITPTATGYTVLATVDGPFDELTGSSSLTGDGGLIDEANVLGVLDQGYTARITVKDDQIVGATPSRFLQVRVSYDSLSAAWDPLAAGIADPNERGLFDDGDGDGESNIAEWLTGTIIDPFVPDGVTASDAELLVASYFANRGVVPFTPNRGPFDDFDSDGFSNLLEIAFGTDPILASSIPSLSVIEKYVADEMLLLNVIPGINGATQASLAPATDFDGDGESNLVELQLGTDPSVGGSFFGADEVDVLVAEGLAAVNAFNDTSTAADDGSFLPSGDFDTGGATNLAELAFGSDPNDAGADDGPLDTVGEVDTEVDSFIDANFTPGTYLAADDPDLDGFNNLEEIALGTNPLVSNP